MGAEMGEDLGDDLGEAMEEASREEGGVGGAEDADGEASVSDAGGGDASGDHES